MGGVVWRGGYIRWFRVKKMVGIEEEVEVGEG